jgi:hypothetical protein
VHGRQPVGRGRLSVLKSSTGLYLASGGLRAIPLRIPSYRGESVNSRGRRRGVGRRSPFGQCLTNGPMLGGAPPALKTSRTAVGAGFAVDIHGFTVSECGENGHTDRQIAGEWSPIGLFGGVSPIAGDNRLNLPRRTVVLTLLSPRQASVGDSYTFGRREPEIPKQQQLTNRARRVGFEDAGYRRAVSGRHLESAGVGAIQDRFGRLRAESIWRNEGDEVDTKSGVGKQDVTTRKTKTKKQKS